MQPTGTNSDRFTVIAGRLEWWVACGLTVFLLGCHVIRLLSAGGLYRDEANSVYLGTQVSIHENFEKLQFDSSPCVWFALLRAWHAVGFAPTDMGWRVLGFIIGVSLVGLMWMAGSRLRGDRYSPIPLVALFLIGFCPATLAVGDSLRVYGLGMCCVVGTVLLTWWAIKHPRVAAWCVAGCMYFVAVHTTFHNAAAVFAIGIAGSCVGVSRRSLWQTLAPLTAGAIAGATLLIYVPMFRGSGEWSYLLKQPLSLEILLSRWVESLHVFGYTQVGDGLSMTFLQKVAAATLWLCFLTLATALTVRALPGLYRDCRSHLPTGVRNRTDDGTDARETLLFIVAGFLSFVTAYLVMLYTRGWMPAPKYYLVAIAFTGILIDWVLRIGSAHTPRTRIAVAIATAVLAILTSQSVFRGAFTRWTNIDLAAKVINERAKDGDLVIVAPWELGVSFSRYCRPGITWMTLPEITDHTVHRYDLYRKVVIDPSAGTELCRAVRRMSVNGGDVWYVGSELAFSSDTRSFSGSPVSQLGISCIDGPFQTYEQLPPLTSQVVAPHENVSIIHFRR